MRRPLPNGVARVPGADPGVIAASDVVAADHLGTISGSGAVPSSSWASTRIGWPSSTEGSPAVVGALGVPLLLSDGLRAWEKAVAASSAVPNTSF